MFNLEPSQWQAFWDKVILVLIFLLLFLLIRWLWHKLLKALERREQQKQREREQEIAELMGGWQQVYQQSLADQESERQKLHEQKLALTKEVAQGHPSLAKQLLQMAGKAHLPLTALHDAELLDQIAERATLEELQVLMISPVKGDVTMDLEADQVRTPVPYPADVVEPAMMTGLEQIVDLLPEYLALPDEQFYQQLVAGDLQVLQWYTTEMAQKRLYMLIDASDSMDNPMKDGLARHIWARRVAINLLLLAVDGGSQYYLRYFDSHPHNLMRATTPDEADTVIETLRRTGMSHGGTNILAALGQGIKDIAQMAGNVPVSDILLISDCEDNSVSLERLQAMLGSSIRLHVALIGGVDVAAFQAVAETYQRFQ